MVANIGANFGFVAAGLLTHEAGEYLHGHDLECIVGHRVWRC
jgi:hypothetical protein